MKKIEDISGTKFNQLTAISFSCRRNGHQVWLWECDCENKTRKEILLSHVKRGSIKSCGCIIIKNNKERPGARTHGGKGTRLYNIWRDIKARCFNPNNKDYGRYGGRGIKMCQEWKDNFQLFRDWALLTHYSGLLQIDRINNDGNYTPHNCRWITGKQNCNNKRNNRLLEYKGQTQTISQWADEYNISSAVLSYRLDNNWLIEEALNKPVDISKWSKSKVLNG